MAKFRIANKGSITRLAILCIVMGIGLVWCYTAMLMMPGESFRGTLPPKTLAQRSLADELRRDVDMLAGIIVHRNVQNPKGFHAAADFIERSLTDAGYAPVRQSFMVQGVECFNLEAEIRGLSRPDEIVVIGAHYDSVEMSPAANDNGSGVAATLALARRFKSSNPACTLRFVLFANEEPPYFQTENMGSMVYARRCKERNENIVGMISLETIGYYSDEPGSQRYPIKPIGWLYPNTGNFIGFVGNYTSRHLVRKAIGAFRKQAQFPSQGAALPGWITGVGWSDHWAFWQVGYPAIMVTDTAPFRYPHYHTTQDTPDKLDYASMARVTEGMGKVIDELAGIEAAP